MNTIQSISPKEALRRTLFEFKLSGAQVAREANLTESQISDFKLGKKDLNTESWMKMISGLPSEARCYYLDLVFNVQDCAKTLRDSDVKYTTTRSVAC